MRCLLPALTLLVLASCAPTGVPSSDDMAPADAAMPSPTYSCLETLDAGCAPAQAQCITTLAAASSPATWRCASPDAGVDGGGAGREVFRMDCSGPFVYVDDCGVDACATWVYDAASGDLVARLAGSPAFEGCVFGPSTFSPVCPGPKVLTQICAR